MIDNYWEKGVCVYNARLLQDMHRTMCEAKVVTVKVNVNRENQRTTKQASVVCFTEWIHASFLIQHFTEPSLLAVEQCTRVPSMYLAPVLLTSPLTAICFADVVRALLAFTAMVGIPSYMTG